MAWITEKTEYVSGFRRHLCKNVKSGDGLEKRADLEYDVLVKRKNKTGKKPGF